MANTYTQLHYHVTWGVKFRHGLLQPAWRQELFGYMAAVIDKAGHKSLLVNGVSDHVHLLFGMRPTSALADLIKEIKQASSRWLNDQRYCAGVFAWQEGYGGFTFGRPELPAFLRYVQEQEAHHRTETFAAEYRRWLDRYEVPHEERYLFHAPQ